MLDIPKTLWLPSRKSAENKPGKAACDDIRLVAHSWAMSTVALVFTLCRWTQTLAALQARSAARILSSFIANFFSDRELIFYYEFEGPLEAAFSNNSFVTKPSTEALMPECPLR